MSSWTSSPQTPCLAHDHGVWYSMMAVAECNAKGVLHLLPLIVLGV
jgi:hypothetical protein